MWQSDSSCGQALFAGRALFDQSVNLRFRLGPVITGIAAGETAFFRQEIGCF